MDVTDFFTMWPEELMLLLETSIIEINKPDNTNPSVSKSPKQVEAFEMHQINYQQAKAELIARLEGKRAEPIRFVTPNLNQCWGHPWSANGYRFTVLTPRDNMDPVWFMNKIVIIKDKVCRINCFDGRHDTSKKNNPIDLCVGVYYAP